MIVVDDKDLQQQPPKQKRPVPPVTKVRVVVNGIGIQ
jgi:hypothetical protein